MNLFSASSLTSRIIQLYSFIIQIAKEFNKYKHLRLTKISELLKNWSDEGCKIFGQILKKYNRSIIDIL